MSDKQQLVKGMFWSAIEKYSSMAVSIVVSMILARLLTPEEFGTVAIATVLISFFSILSSMGIAPAIIQRRDLTQNDLNNIFTFSCYIGFLLALLFFFGSWIIAGVYKVRALVIICQILSVQVFFSAANMVPNALMQKNLRFKEIAKRTLLLQLISGAISIIAALFGAGVYALLISPIITCIGIFIYNRHYYKVQISRHFSIEPIKKIFSYSSYQFLFQFIAYFSGNIDKLLIGKYISTNDLGYYQKSHQLVQLPLSSVGAVVNPVLQPVLSKYQDEKEELACRYNKLIRLIATVAFPTGVLIYFCGAEIIRFFYGSQWDLAIPTFKIMAITAPIQIVLSSSGSFFQASNETKRLFLLGTTNAVISILLTIVAVVFGGTIESVALAWSATNILGLLATYYFMYVIVLKKPFYYIISDFVFPVLISVLTALLLYIETRIFCSNNIGVFIIKCFTYCLIVLLSIQLSKQVDILGYFKRYVSKKSDSINS